MKNNNSSPLKVLLRTALTVACMVSVAAEPASAGKHTLGFNFNRSVLSGEAPKPEFISESGTLASLLVLGTTFVVRRRDHQGSDD